MIIITSASRVECDVNTFSSTTLHLMLVIQPSFLDQKNPKNIQYICNYYQKY